MVGYRRLKNLREFLVRANLPFKQGDEKAVPESLKPKQIAQVTDNTDCVIGKHTRTLRKTITDFFLPVAQIIPIVVAPKQKDTTVTSNIAGPSTSKAGGTPPSRRGFNFCNTRNCRYCPNLNQTGEITSSVTGKSYRTMKNVSCRSSNLIYCITCKLCSKQYVDKPLLG